MHVHVDPNNERYSNYNSEFIIGKSSEIESDFFDTLVYASRNIEKAIIPNFVRIIGPYAFERCCKLKRIEISNDSMLQVIDEYSFSYSEIENISIPSSFIEFKDGWRSFTPKLTEINIMPNNQLFLCLDGKFILKKSSEKVKNYDVLEFAARDVETVIIPTFIRIISPYAFEYCIKSQKCEIQKNSELQIVKKYAFITVRDFKKLSSNQTQNLKL